MFIVLEGQNYLIMKKWYGSTRLVLVHRLFEGRRTLCRDCYLVVGHNHLGTLPCNSLRKSTVDHLIQLLKERSIFFKHNTR